MVLVLVVFVWTLTNYAKSNVRWGHRRIRCAMKCCLVFERETKKFMFFLSLDARRDDYNYNVSSSSTFCFSHKLDTRHKWCFVNWMCVWYMCVPVCVCDRMDATLFFFHVFFSHSPVTTISSVCHAHRLCNVFQFVQSRITNQWYHSPVDEENENEWEN